MVNKENKIILFQSHKIRRIWHNDEWFFSVIDIIGALTDSTNPRDYWYKMKIRVKDEAEFELSTICRQLKLKSADEKVYNTDCANTEGVLRIIQSIPSPKAEPFKRWLAKIGYKRIQEIEDPELATQRTRELYKAKGYPDSWIEKRMRGIAIRQDLTEEWSKRGITNQKNYSILTAEISKATFGMTPTEYKIHKNIPINSNANLRDNMIDLELIFTMLGEKVTTEISAQEKPETLVENKKVAKRGGKVAGNARKETEKEIGKSIISNQNYLPEQPSDNE